MNQINYQYFIKLNNKQVKQLMKTNQHTVIIWLIKIYFSGKNPNNIIKVNFKTDALLEYYFRNVTDLNTNCENYIKNNMISDFDLEWFAYNKNILDLCINKANNPETILQTHTKTLFQNKHLYLKNKNPVILQHLMQLYSFQDLGGVAILARYNISDIIKTSNCLKCFLDYCLANPYLLNNYKFIICSVIADLETNTVMQEYLLRKMPCEIVFCIIYNLNNIIYFNKDYLIHDSEIKLCYLNYRRPGLY